MLGNPVLSVLSEEPNRNMDSCMLPVTLTFDSSHHELIRSGISVSHQHFVMLLVTGELNCHHECEKFPTGKLIEEIYYLNTTGESVNISM